ncbi:MAG: hypothetical protein [Circular genetic element sp.]|nr:MAG: hypothetical protein [Circular genetic element sp.]
MLFYGPLAQWGGIESINISLHTPTPSEANHRWPQDACTRIPSSSPFHRRWRSKNLIPKMCIIPLCKHRSRMCQRSVHNIHFVEFHVDDCIGTIYDFVPTETVG